MYLQRLDYPVLARVHVYFDPHVKTIVDHNKSPVGAAIEVKVRDTMFCVGDCPHGEPPSPPVGYCTRPDHKCATPGEGPCNGYPRT